MNQSSKTETVGTPVQDRAPDHQKAEKISEELSERVAQHANLPTTSFLGIIGVSSLANDQASNQVVMADLLDSLASEIGATKASGALKALRENQQAETELDQLARSEDPTTQAEVKQAKKELKAENAKLTSMVHDALSAEGMDFSDAQIQALCASPNAEDTASMISAFGSLKTIAAEMENRLRARPSQDQAQKYYGAHCAMLMALDKIQKRAMDNIENKHIPAANTIKEDSLATAKNAGDILNDKGGPELSISEQQALQWNIGSCQKTVDLAQRTEEKLRQNLAIIRAANDKLGKSIATAKNCHMTAMLQKEIIALETSHAQEFARIEALTIPELAAVNFADPSRPEVSPPPKGPRM